MVFTEEIYTSYLTPLMGLWHWNVLACIGQLLVNQSVLVTGAQPIFKIIITSLVKHYLGVYALCVHTKSIGNYANTTKNTKTKAHSAPTTMVIHSSNS